MLAVSRQDWDDEAYREWARRAADRSTPATCGEDDRERVVARLGPRARRRDRPRRPAPGTGPGGRRPGGLPGPAQHRLPAHADGAARGRAARGRPGRRGEAVRHRPADARELNEVLHGCCPEEAVFRIDHFLAKQTVLNVLGLRFANRVFEPVWNAQHVDRRRHRLRRGPRPGGPGRLLRRGRRPARHAAEPPAAAAGRGRDGATAGPGRRDPAGAQGRRAARRSPPRTSRTAASAAGTPPARSGAGSCPTTPPRTASTPPAAPRPTPSSP